MKTLNLSKGKHRFVISYQPGDERHVLDALADMARRPDLPFDWFDAAILSHQIGSALAAEVAANCLPGAS